MKIINLTDSQAEWLQSHLDSMLNNSHWKVGPLADDADGKEHAKTIRDKIKEKRDADEWK